MLLSQLSRSLSVACILLAACTASQPRTVPMPGGAIPFDSSETSSVLSCASDYLNERGYLVQRNTLDMNNARSFQATRESSNSGAGYSADVIRVYVLTVAGTPNMRLGAHPESREYAERGNLAGYTLREPPRPGAVRAASEVGTICTAPR